MKFQSLPTLCVFALMSVFILSCNPRTYDFQKGYDTAFDHKFVKELKGNNLFILLQNNKEVIDTYRNQGREKSAMFWEKEDAKYNAHIKQAFKDSWNFCDVFFYTEKLYFNTEEFDVEDINGKKHIVELGRGDQLFMGKFLEFCNANTVADAGRQRYASNQLHLMVEKWPEDAEQHKKTLKLEAGGCLSKSSIRLLVSQMQRRLERTYNFERI